MIFSVVIIGKVKKTCKLYKILVSQFFFYLDEIREFYNFQIENHVYMYTIILVVSSRTIVYV